MWVNFCTRLVVKNGGGLRLKDCLFFLLIGRKGYQGYSLFGWILQWMREFSPFVLVAMAKGHGSRFIMPHVLPVGSVT
jgi:hypothetical protein